MSGQLATSENLWPADFWEFQEKTPVSILREQGKALGERTKNIVIGTVNSEADGQKRFRHYFILYCRPLSYRVTLFSVEHGVDQYPAQIQIDPGGSIDVKNAEQFTEKLKEIFSRDETKKIVASLLVQSSE